MANEIATQTNGAPLQVAPMQKRPSILESPEIFDRAWQFCTIMADTDMVPKQCRGNPANLLARIETLMSLGITAYIPNLNGVAVINGVPSIWGSLLVGICQSHSSWADYKVEWLDAQSGEYRDFKAGITLAGCRVTALRRGRTPKSGEFSVEDAQRAGLLNSELWKKYLPDMLKGKAMRRALHMQYADILHGIQSAEDLSEGEYIDHDAYPSEPDQEPPQEQPKNEPEAACEPAQQEPEPEGDLTLAKLQNSVKGAEAQLKEKQAIMQQVHQEVKPNGNNKALAKKKIQICKAFESIGKGVEDIEQIAGCSIDKLTSEHIERLRVEFNALKIKAENEQN